MESWVRTVGPCPTCGRPGTADWHGATVTRRGHDVVAVQATSFACPAGCVIQPGQLMHAYPARVLGDPER